MGHVMAYEGLGPFFGGPVPDLASGTGIVTARRAPRSWVSGLVMSGFEAIKVFSLLERIQSQLGALDYRSVDPGELLAPPPPTNHELLVLPLRHQDGYAAAGWLAELRRRGVHAPALLVMLGEPAGCALPYAELGAVDMVALDGSDFELWRSLKLLERSHRRERELRELREELEAAHAELREELEAAHSEIHRRREEVGYLTFSLATHEIDEELSGDRGEERARVYVRKRIERSERFGTPLTCFRICVDDLSRIKEEHGAGFAAFVLVQVAYRLKRTLRPSDFLWRYGENGFLLLSSGATDADVTSQARRLIAAVAEGTLEDRGSKIAPSISIGASRHRPEMSTPSELIDSAQLALGTARHRGEGQFVLI